MGEVGSVGVPAVGVAGVVVSPALGDVDAGGVSTGGVGEVEGEVELPVVAGGAEDEGVVCWAITVPANIAEQTIVARRTDFGVKHFMRASPWGKFPVTSDGTLVLMGAARNFLTAM